MANTLQILEQIERLEMTGRHVEAQTFRKKLLEAAESATDDECLSICNSLVREKVTIDDVERASESEMFHQRLHGLSCRRLGANHIVSALAKRMLARMAMIQGRYPEAVSWLEQTITVLTSLHGPNRAELIEATDKLIELTGYFDPAKATEIRKTWQEESRQLYPLCKHLKPLEEYLLASGIKIQEYGEREFGSNGSVNVQYDAWLDVRSLRERLQLDSCVEILEWEDMKVGDGRGFVCTIHHDSIEGHYHQRKGAPIVS